MTVNKKTVLGVAVVVLSLFVASKVSHASYSYTKPTPLPQPSKPDLPSKPEKVKLSVFNAIKDASNKYGVPLHVSLAVVKVESNFTPSAVSHKGASGLYQLMPRTAQGLGVNDVFDIRQNANGGNKYLAALYRKYGNWDDALAAYNWGPGNLDSDKPIPTSVNTYVNKVMKAASEYER